MQQDEKPVIYWILQDNQVTPYIVDFLKLIKHRVHEFITIRFMVPAISADTLKTTKPLEPVPFQVTSVSKENSYEGYCRKRDLIGDAGFTEGLLFYRALLLDDLGGGNLYQTQLHLPKEKNVRGVILQIPTPLGSSEAEERIFYAWIHLAKLSGVPVLGYELLPLSTRWTLAPSLLDGIITTSEESFDLVKREDTDLNNKIWLLPRYEGRFFSPATTPFWRNGLGTASKYQNELNIHPEKTVLYIPHNVAMTYEYNMLLNHLKPMTEKLHIMFSIGKDQIRGTHKHDEIIETVGREELKSFSYSFHDLNRSWEMTMADGVVACADCYGTCVASSNNIPTLIYDPAIPPYEKGVKKSTNSISEFKNNVETLIQSHNKRKELSKILVETAKIKVA